MIHSRPPLKPNTRLLAICPIGIGNFLLLVPALEHLKTKRPDLHLTLLSLKTGITALALRYPLIDAVITVDANKKQGAAAKLSLVKQLFRKFDVSISFFPSNRLEYNLLPFAALIPKRVAYRYHSRSFRTLSWLNNIKVPVFDKLHDLTQNFTATHELGLPLPEETAMPVFLLSETEKAFAVDYVRKAGLEGKTLIGIHPGSSAEHHMDKKRWPVSSFAELAGLILKEKDARFLIFGGPEEKEIKDELGRALGSSAAVVETKSLFETAAVIARCSRFISNDSGLMHVATSLRVKTCGIFGPTADSRTAPFGKEHLVVRGPEECSPCWTIRNVGKREGCLYEDFRCLRNLTAEAVFGRMKDWV
jgi:heptosyltransferase II